MNLGVGQQEPLLENPDILRGEQPSREVLLVDNSIVDPGS